MRIDEIRTNEVKEKEQLNEFAFFLIPIIMKLVMSTGVRMAAQYVIRKIGLEGAKAFVKKMLTVATKQLGSHGGKTLSKALVKKGKKAGNWGLTHSPGDMMDRLQDLANYVNSGAEGAAGGPVQGPTNTTNLPDPNEIANKGETPGKLSTATAAAVAQAQQAQDAEQAKLAQAQGGRGGVVARAQARAAAAKA